MITRALLSRAAAPVSDDRCPDSIHGRLAMNGVPLSRPRADAYYHRRESSLSTSASTSSELTRVLPFATAAFNPRSLLPISSESPVHAQGEMVNGPACLRDEPRRKLIGALSITSKGSSAVKQRRSTIASPPHIRIGGEARSLDNGDVYYPAIGHPRFALAQPRRVVTVSNMPLSQETLSQEALSSPAPRVAGKRISRQAGQRSSNSRAAGNSLSSGKAAKRRSVAIGITSMLPAATSTSATATVSNSSSTGSCGLGARTRPIIGLGLTLNPADTLVTLQARCRRAAINPMRKIRVAAINSSTLSINTSRSTSCSAALAAQRQLRQSTRHARMRSSSSNCASEMSAAAEAGLEVDDAQSLLAVILGEHSPTAPPSQACASAGAGAGASGRLSLSPIDLFMHLGASVADLLGSPRDTDPELVSLVPDTKRASHAALDATAAGAGGAGSVQSLRAVPTQQPRPESVVEGCDLERAGSVRMVPVLSSSPSPSPSPPPQQLADSATDCSPCLQPVALEDAVSLTGSAPAAAEPCSVPVETCCLLCFERVRIPKKRSQNMRCPGCAHPLFQR
ncbi:hypothetical protein GGI07_002872 [Coemansia sp. Benny D115]|nr:hypothetical protein GGI07_002872 [Coemansia sp. Benny D115]